MEKSTKKGSTAGRIGQPRKYDEPTRSITFKLPDSTIQKLKELAKLHNMSSTEYVYKSIEEDFNKNHETIENIARLQEALNKELAKIRKE